MNLSREFHYHWQWTFRSSREDLWPFVSDTNRFNRDTGLPPVELLPAIKSSGSRRRHLQFRRMGMTVAWQEEPFEWEFPRRFSVRRIYSKGPVAEMFVAVELEPASGGGTRLDYDVRIRPRNFLGMLAIPVQVGLLCRRDFHQALARYDRWIQERTASTALPREKPGAVTGRFRSKLQEAGCAVETIDPVLGHIEAGDPMSLASMRPYALADAWGLPRGDMLKTFLLATRAGVVELQWKILCPSCRGTDRPVRSLREVSKQAHCSSCNIDFEVNFDRYTELTFRPSRTVRDLSVREYCIGGPQVTPHIQAQQKLCANETRRFQLHLKPGKHRLRIPGIAGGVPVTVTPDGPRDVQVVLPSGEAWPETEIKAACESSWHLTQPKNCESLVMLERMAWTDQAVTAAEVTRLQIFRDLFSREALRPGEQISVGRLALVFTDLKDSTRLYQQIGDAPAFGRVMQHFDLLKEVIARHGGAVVKTIGDAVMAVFPAPAPALQAMMEAQERLAHPAPGGQAFHLKAGIHEGTCITVTLNDQLDYFGTTANMAARLCHFSSGHDAVISRTVFEDPEVQALVRAGKRLAEPFDSPIKGFDGETFHLYRVRTAASRSPQKTA